MCARSRSRSKTSSSHSPNERGSFPKTEGAHFLNSHCHEIPHSRFSPSLALALRDLTAAFRRLQHRRYAFHPRAGRSRRAPARCAARRFPRRPSAAHHPARSGKSVVDRRCAVAAASFRAGARARGVSFPAVSSERRCCGVRDPSPRRVVQTPPPMEVLPEAMPGTSTAPGNASSRHRRLQ